MVLEVSRLLAVPTELDLLLNRIAEICCILLDCEVASIFVHDPATNELWSRIVMESTEIRFPATKGIVGSAFASNSLVHVPDPYQDPRFNPEPDRRNGFITRSLLACPMPDVDGKALGVIEGINKRGKAFGENDFGLIHLVAEQAAVAIQRHQFQQAALESMKLRHEMNLARTVQRGMIPKSPPVIPGIKSAGWAQAASTTGGDCYDLWKTADGRLGILLADASGHGLAPALIVSQVRTLFRAVSDIESDPHRMLAMANRRLCGDLEVGRFVTAFLAFLLPDGTLNWSSAGHGPVFVRRSPGAELEELEPPLMPLGVDAGFTADPAPPIHLEPGGALMLVSDGIFEAPNPAGERFNVPRMKTMFDAHRTAPPGELLAMLRQATQDWQAVAEPADDQTIVIVQRDG